MAVTTVLFHVYDRFVPYAIGWNTTSSIPLGIYFSEKYHAQAPALGDLLCFRYEAPAWAADRGYAPPGQRFCKPVAGLPGDELLMDADKLTVVHADGSRKSFPVLTADSKGRAMSHAALQLGPIPSGSYLLVSDYKTNSFDSRYLGLIAQSRVTHQVWPLLVQD